MSGKTTKTTVNKAKSGGALPKIPTRQGLYTITSSYAKEAIETLVAIMRSGKQESVRMAASKTLLDKALPDLKAMELQGKDGDDLKLVVTIIEDKHNASSTSD